MSSQTLKQLKETAKELNLKGYSKFKKDELIKFIEEHKKKLKDKMEKKGKRCNAMCFDKTIEQCDEYSNEKYCSLHRNRYKFENDDECSVCFDKMDPKKEIPLACGHWFHKECLKPTNVHSCPVCRCCMDKNDVKFIFGENHVEKNNFTQNDIVEYGEFVNNGIQQQEQQRQFVRYQQCNCELCTSQNGIISYNHSELEYSFQCLMLITQYVVDIHDEYTIDDEIVRIISMDMMCCSGLNQNSMFRISKMGIVILRNKLNRSRTSHRPIFNFINVEYYQDMRTMISAIKSSIDEHSSEH